jgi:two-component system sensor histidine kinase BaeS
MRRRLTVAILLLVAATLLVTTVSSYYLVRRAVISTSQRQLNGQAQAIAHYFATDAGITVLSFHRQLDLIGEAGAFAGIEPIEVFPGGRIVGQLPSGLTVAQIKVPALLEGRQVSGHEFSLLVYTAIPVPLAKATRYTLVLVISRQAHDPANGLLYFGLVGVVGLLIAALVASDLARRFTHPVVSAVATTRRMASGDLDARVAVSPHELPEFAQLADSINTMGANLMRARDQERQFLMSVSHELRTPLTSIRGYADAVVDGATDDPLGAATVISTEARRLERLVQDLLDLARLDADRFSLDLRPVDGSDVVHEVVQGFRHRAHELGLVLSLAPGSEGPVWMQADPDRLGQVVANLVENAASFAREEIVVGVTTVVPGSPPASSGPRAGMSGAEAVPPGAGAVPVIWVVDDGPGIRPDELPMVFDRHFSSDRAGGRRKGSGLGLAIVSELATAMGATVRAESPVSGGRGTRLVVWLRAAPAPAGPVPDVHPGPHHPHPGPNPDQGPGTGIGSGVAPSGPGE